MHKLALAGFALVLAAAFAGFARAEPGLQSDLTAISGQGAGHVEVSPTGAGQDDVFIAQGTANIHGALPNKTSEGGSGAAHFVRQAPPPGPAGFQFDVIFRLISDDGTQVLLSDCMTATVK